MISAGYRSNAWLFPFVELMLILVAALADPQMAASSKGTVEYQGKLVWVAAARTGAPAKQGPTLRIEVQPAVVQGYQPYALAVPASTPRMQFKSLDDLRTHIQREVLRADVLKAGRVEIVVLVGAAAQDMLLVHEYVRALCKSPCSDAVIVSRGS